MVTIQWLEGGDKTQPLLAKPGSYHASAPVAGRPAAGDGHRGRIGPDIWVYDWQRDTMTRLTFGGGEAMQPVWSPDGRYIVPKHRKACSGYGLTGPASRSH